RCFTGNEGTFTELRGALSPSAPLTTRSWVRMGSVPHGDGGIVEVSGLGWPAGLTGAVTLPAAPLGWPTETRRAGPTDDPSPPCDGEPGRDSARDRDAAPGRDAAPDREVGAWDDAGSRTTSPAPVIPIRSGPSGPGRTGRALVRERW